MKSIFQAVLLHILFSYRVLGQDVLNKQIFQYYNQLPYQNDQIETVNSHRTDFGQRASYDQSDILPNVGSSVTNDVDKSDHQNSQASRGQSKKIYRIKNPFQHQENSKQQNIQNIKEDSETGSSNQLSAVQYSLPPDEFLKQMRAESQYYQQQLSTSSPILEHTVTSQPVSQYSTLSPSIYDNTPQQNQIQQSRYQNSYPYGFQNSYGFDNIQSTPSPSTYLSSPPTSSYLATPTNNYVSSSSAIYYSSLPNMQQQYVSSPFPIVHSTSPEYNNIITSSYSNKLLDYENNSLLKKIQIDHYDNSNSGVRYPYNVQQYLNQYPTSTEFPSTSDPFKTSWQNNFNRDFALNKDMSLQSFQNLQNTNSQMSIKPESDLSNTNLGTHRTETLGASNDLYYNYVHPDHQILDSTQKTKKLDTEHENAQYSHGDYGWRLQNNNKSLNEEKYHAMNYDRSHLFTLGSDGKAVSQINFHVDPSRPTNNKDYDLTYTPESIKAQEFAKAAVRAQEDMKNNQQYFNSYSLNRNPSTESTSLSHGNNFNYHNINPFYHKAYFSLENKDVLYDNSQRGIIRASPIYYSNNLEPTLNKLSSDKNSSIKNTLPINLSISEVNSTPDRYSFYDTEKVHNDPMKTDYQSMVNTLSKDINSGYNNNMRNKLDDIPNIFNHGQKSQSFYSKPQSQDLLSEHFANRFSQTNHFPQTTNQAQENTLTSTDIHPNQSKQTYQFPAEITNGYNLNYVPRKLLQGLSTEILHQYKNNIDHDSFSSSLPYRLNQNVDSHQTDATSNIIKKIMTSKHPSYSLNVNQPETDTIGSIPNNGLRGENPFNINLKLVAEALKEKSLANEANLPLKEQFSKISPLTLDISALQQLLMKNGYNFDGLLPLSDGISSISNPYLGAINNNRYPYQGVKYSRSQEEEESIIPIADSSNHHPIGAVIDEDDSFNSQYSTTDYSESHRGTVLDSNINDDKKKLDENSVHIFSHRATRPNPYITRNKYRKRSKLDVNEKPYLFLKTPHTHRNRLGSRNSRRRPIKKIVQNEATKTKPLFESNEESSINNDSQFDVPILLRPPPVTEERIDIEAEDRNSTS